LWAFSSSGRQFEPLQIVVAGSDLLRFGRPPPLIRVAQRGSSRPPRRAVLLRCWFCLNPTAGGLPSGCAPLFLSGLGVLTRRMSERMQVIRLPTMILPKVRDPRFVTTRRGGTLTESHHHLLALWAASCAEHVLGLFQSAQPDDRRPGVAIEHARAWVRGEVKMMQARKAAGQAQAAARNLRGAPRHAAYAAGQAAVVPHVAAHELGAGAYAIKAVCAAAPEDEPERAGRIECRWQREQLPEEIRELVLDNQRLRNDICWSVFDC
jgi:hypothetical protein